MERFKEDLIIEWDSKVNKIKHNVNFLTINDNNKNKIGFIFINGLNGTKSMISYFSHPLFNNASLITFDLYAQGLDKNKGSRFKNKYIDELDLIICFLKQKYKHIKTWYLLGESWGSALCCLYLKKYGYKKIIDKTLIWNMPYSIVDVSNENFKEKSIRCIKTMITFFFGIETKIKNKINDKLINDPVILRAFKLYSCNNYPKTSPTIAAWKSFKPAWKFFNKHFNDCSIYYFQTKDDVLCNWKKINKFKETNNHIIEIDHGFHIASLDKTVNKELFNKIKNIIKK